MNTQSISFFHRSVIHAAILALALPAASWAAPLSLSSAPAGTASRAPAPNVIVSVDNSSSMGNTGIAQLQDALRQTFDPTNVFDGSIRLGWQAMNGCYTIPSAGAPCNNLNALKVFDGTHRQNFDNWVNALTWLSSTPSHRMLRNAGDYLKQPISIDSAWASEPGVTQNPVLSCRRSYNLFMTDGAWNTLTLPVDNAVGDADNTARALPDGTVYDIVSDNTQVYRAGATGTQGGQPFSTTLSDMAFNYWATDLQPGIANDVKPLTKSPGPATFTSGATSRVIPQYWNPRNDPATWQHMTMYTVGFKEAATWSVTPSFGTSTWTGGDYDQLVLGLTNWPNPITGGINERITELWHMALNSRGKFIPAPDAQSLATAFKDILNEILADTAAPLTSLSASATSLNRDSAIYAAGYDSTAWSGQVTAYGVSAGTGAVSTTGLWGTTATTPAKPVSTATVMDGASFVPGNRVVLSAQPLTAGAPPTGIVWDWPTISAAKKTELNTIGSMVDTRGEDRLNFIRGDRTRESSQPHITGQPPNIFRNRGSRHGDIVNSEVWFTPGVPESPYQQNGYATFRTSNAARMSMLYVGANVGMLHGFDAADGSEKIAYIPDGIHARLPQLTQPTYGHRYFVDGSPFTGDVHDGSAWRTYLAGFPGRGGKGYFVLDVTDPSAFASTSAATTVVLDTTATTDPDVGYIASQPVLQQTTARLSSQLTRMNNGRWALVTGNGANSSSEKAVLLIQYVDGDKALKKITADNTGGNGNGLSAPRLVDLNGDHIPDVAYAGDLRGNLWKFDLSDPAAANWKVAFSGAALYITKDAGSVRQPITTPPGWLFHPDGGLMVSVGTGRSLTDADRSSTQVQTLYGIYDPTSITINATVNALTGSSTVVLGATNNAVTDARASLVQQTISAASTGTAKSGNTLWTVSSNPVPYTGVGAKKGWFLELPVAHERSDKAMKWIGGRLFSISSSVPAAGGDPNVESCDPPTTAGQSYFTILNIINGSAPTHAIFNYVDTSGNPVVLPASSGVPSRASDPTNGISVYLNSVDSSGDQICATVSANCPNRLGAPPLLLWPTWRQAQ